MPLVYKVVRKRTVTGEAIYKKYHNSSTNRVDMTGFK